MKLSGFQKLTLLDFPGKVACTVFTPGCNFRCPFCHNASLVTHVDRSLTISPDEIFSFLRKRQGLLEGVCITGGEPLLQNGIEEFIQNIRLLGYAVKLDTNGSFPDKLDSILRAGLVDYVAMDIKASPENYDRIAGVPTKLSDIARSRTLLMESGIAYEFRTTVVKGLHTKEDFLSIGPFIRGADAYYIQSYVDSGDTIKSGYAAFDKEELKTFAELTSPFVKSCSLRGV